MARKNRLFLVPSIIGLGGVAGLVMPAQASTIEGPITTTTPIPSTLTVWPAESITFPQFNPSLGTLDSVELQFKASMNTTLTVTNENDTTSSDGQAYTELQVTVQDSGDNLVDLSSNELDVSSPKGNYSLAPLGNVTLATLSKSGTADDVYDSSYGTGWTSNIQPEFTGFGNISLPASTLVYAWSSNSNGDTTASDVTYASLTGNVTYTYDAAPVPEPTTMSLVLIGGSAAALRRRRRTAHA